MAKKDLYEDTTVPLPSQALHITEGDGHADACKKIDLFFDDIIRNYPQDTKVLLCKMYYEDENLIVKTLSKGQHANWEWRPYATNAPFSMLLDERIHPCPILSRVLKIHEIGCHIGQAHERLNKAGKDAFLSENHNGDFGYFSELSVAPVEKMIMDAIPVRLIEEDVQFATTVKAREGLMKDFLLKKTCSYDEYAHLSHRKSIGDAHAIGLQEEDYRLLHARLDVKSYDVSQQTAGGMKKGFKP